INEITEDDSPLGWDRFKEPDFEEILLRRSRFVLSKGCVGVATKPGLDFPIQRLKMGLGPIQFQPNAVQLREMAVEGTPNRFIHRSNLNTETSLDATTNFAELSTLKSPSPRSTQNSKVRTNRVSLRCSAQRTGCCSG